MVCPPSRGLVCPRLPLSPSPHMCACVGWCPPCQGLVSPWSPIISPPVCLCVRWCVRLPEAFSPLSPSLSDMSSSLSSFLSPSMSLFFFPFAAGGLILHIFLNSVLLGVLKAFSRCPLWCWMVCRPSRGLVSHLVSQLVSLLVSLCGG